jgi:hypothetical protein
VTNRKIQRSRRVHGSRAAASRALNELRLEVDRQKAAGLSVWASSQVTVTEVITAHLTAIKNDVAPGTYGSYESAHRLHLLNLFGSKRVDSLTAQSFRDLYASESPHVV